MSSFTFIFSIYAAFALGAQATENRLASALASDNSCSNGADGPACDLQLLQLTDQARKQGARGGKGGKGGKGNCGQTVSRYNYASPTEAFAPQDDCALGGYQSPIDIFTPLVQPGSAGLLEANFWKSEDQYVINTGHNLEVDTDPDGHLVVDGAKYKMVQYHIHMGAEHRINGMLPAAELHIVMSYSNPNLLDNRTAVVGILFDIDLNPFSKGNELIGSFLKDIPPQGCANPIGTVDLGKEFAHQLEGPYWSYNGSLTTPGCTQNVRWQVMQRRAKISMKQYTTFKSQAYWFPQNNRPVQPVNGRIVFENNPNLRRGASSSTPVPVRAAALGAPAPSMEPHELAYAASITSS